MTRRRAWVASIAAAAGIAVTGALGAWQLGRAHEKETLAAAQAAGAAQAPLDAAGFLAAQRRSQLYRPVRLRGQWVPQHTVFLDNRQMGGRVGFYVATPLRLSGSQAAVLVQRGWAPRNFVDRTRLPEVPTPAGEVELEARIAPPPARLYQFDAAASGPIRQNLELAGFARESGLPLLEDVSVQQTGAAADGLSRDWASVVAARGPATNYGYAVQWWALSALIAILYAWFQFLQPRRRARPR